MFARRFLGEKALYNKLVILFGLSVFNLALFKSVKFELYTKIQIKGFKQLVREAN